MQVCYYMLKKHKNVMFQAEVLVPVLSELLRIVLHMFCVELFIFYSKDFWPDLRMMN